jgi:uncharacterized coiled-coil protein SlyX
MSLTATDKKEIRAMMVDTVTSALEEIVVPRFEGLEGRMDGLESRMDGLENKMSSLENRMDSLENRMGKQERTTNELRDELRASATSLHRRIDEVETNLTGKIEALENDIKEIYIMIAKLQTLPPAEKKFAKLSLEQKILQSHARIASIAKQAGVTLPSLQ